MMSVPMVLEGEKSDVRMVEREDYIGDEVGINIVGGKAIMAAETRHADGRNDLVVFPGVAVGSLQI